MTESEKAARQYAGYGLETSEVLLALSNDTEDYRKYIAFKHGYETAQKQNTELKEALKELKRFIPSLRVLVDRQFNEPQNCFDLFDQIEEMKL